jgi:hypothetical protein
MVGTHTPPSPTLQVEGFVPEENGLAHTWGAEVNSRDRAHIKQCYLSEYVDLRFRRLWGSDQYFEERCWIDPMDIHIELACFTANGLNGWYRSLVVCGQANMDSTLAQHMFLQCPGMGGDAPCQEGPRETVPI